MFIHAALKSKSEKWEPHKSPMNGWLVKNYGTIVKDVQNTFCDKVDVRTHINNMTKSTVPLLELLSFKQIMFEKCPNLCRCQLSNMNIPLWVDVSCSEANMSSLPKILPPNTQILNVSFNHIKALK